MSIAARRVGAPSLAAILLGVAAGALPGCQHDQASIFPPGLEPLEADTAPAAAPGAWTEALATASGNDGYIWVHGRGYIFAAPATVWAATKEPATMYARCSTDARTATANDEPSYEYSFAVHYTVHQVLTVEWDDDWRYGTITGTAAAPALAMIHHQKVQGSSFISLSEGTVQLLATSDPQVTELQFVEHLEAISGSAADVTRGAQDNYNRLLATVHGLAAPGCPP
jgi:hypothetical protein